MKHAYLILAHENAEQLQLLLSCIDDERNDIFLHIDQKADFDGRNLKANHSTLIVLKNRIDARWGDFSLVEAELLLFEEASKNGPYSYYHLLSGSDLPLHSQDFIHIECDRFAGREFIGFALNAPERELRWRMRYFLYSRDFKSPCLWKRLIRRVGVKFQEVFAGCRRLDGMVIKKGPQWCSVTHDFVLYLLKNKLLIRKLFVHTYCPDELFVQTLCWNSYFKHNVFNLNEEFVGCKRYIKWKNGELLPLCEDDVENMMKSDLWFGRKFSRDKMVVIDAVVNQLH